MDSDEGTRRTKHDADTTSSVRAVQNAALERALLSPTGDADYVAFAGALERTRTTGHLSLAGVAILACLVSLQLDCEERPSLDFATERPRDETHLVDGAIVALNRFDLTTAEAAALANRSVEDFEAELERRG
ncbi:hypothetical protein SAMN04487950_1700 [Halogranum rubrum]|uniref:Uncharacterized protein n=1 Tax=Halogranum rubrum TaxID=553466 RepID=A0A1I4D731_9EURY|nr:hypothetical protein [Halogranum rubrum]SFK89388.1 hypothetical protein SAMN04487950_1700 [Halogranum rubrum]